MNIRNKRGKVDSGVWVALAIFFIIAIVLAFQLSNILDWIDEKEISKPELKKPIEILEKQFEATSKSAVAMRSGIGTILGIFIGKVPLLDVGEGKGNPMGSLIVILCLWIMFALLFGDIIKNFGAFDQKIAYVVGILLATITANLGMIHGTMIFFTKVLAGFGIAAVYIGLGAAFVVFIMIELGLTSFAPWLMKRKLMSGIHKSNIEADAGATVASSVLANLGTISKGLKATVEKSKKD